MRKEQTEQSSLGHKLIIKSPANAWGRARPSVLVLTGDKLLKPSTHEEEVVRLLLPLTSGSDNDKSDSPYPRRSCFALQCPQVHSTLVQHVAKRLPCGRTADEGPGAVNSIKDREPSRGWFSFLLG